MARPVSTDFLHSMRFHVTSALAGSSTTDPLQNTKVQQPGGEDGVSAGFMSCSTPEATTEAVEYREGLYNYPRKFPGNTTVSDCSLQKGVARGDGSFWAWLMTVIYGAGEYRADVQIKHYDRQALTGSQNFSFSSEALPARTYYLKNAFPTRHKVAADLDASSSDVSVMELDLAFEWFTVDDRPDPIPVSPWGLAWAENAAARDY